mgnify:CR=1 FL=1
MFGEDQMLDAIQAYEMETSPKGNDEFTNLRRKHDFYKDIRSEEAAREQIKLFIRLISNTDRDEYKNRYVVQTFLLEFCRYLDKDFLFSITDGRTFFSTKDKMKGFTGAIYEAHKRFTQSIALNSLEHLLEDYGTLLRYAEPEAYEEKKEGGEGAGLWSGNKLW